MNLNRNQNKAALILLIAPILMAGEKSLINQGEQAHEPTVVDSNGTGTGTGRTPATMMSGLSGLSRLTGISRLMSSKHVDDLADLIEVMNKDDQERLGSILKCSSTVLPKESHILEIIGIKEQPAVETRCELLSMVNLNQKTELISTEDVNTNGTLFGLIAHYLANEVIAHRFHSDDSPYSSKQISNNIQALKRLLIAYDNQPLDTRDEFVRNILTAIKIDEQTEVSLYNDSVGVTAIAFIQGRNGTETKAVYHSTKLTENEAMNDIIEQAKLANGNMVTIIGFTHSGLNMPFFTLLLKKKEAMLQLSKYFTQPETRVRQDACIHHKASLVKSSEVLNAWGEVIKNRIVIEEKTVKETEKTVKETDFKTAEADVPKIIAGHKAQIGQYLQQISNLKTQIANITQAKNAVDAKQVGLEAALRNLQQQIDQGAQKILSLENDLANSQQQEAENLAKAAQAESELKEYFNKISDDHECIVNAIRDIDTSFDSGMRALKSLNPQFPSVQPFVDSMHQKLDQLKTKENAYTTELENAKKHVTALNNSLNNVREDLAKQRAITKQIKVEISLLSGLVKILQSFVGLLVCALHKFVHLHDMPGGFVRLGGFAKEAKASAEQHYMLQQLKREM